MKRRLQQFGVVILLILCADTIYAAFDVTSYGLHIVTAIAIGVGVAAMWDR